MAVVLAVLAAACGGDDGSTDSSADSSAPQPEQVSGPPPEVTGNPDAWPLANGDYASTRAQVDSPINSDTVGQLEIAWQAELPGSAMFGNGATNPLIADGVVYVGDLTTSVRAFDLETGDELWGVGQPGDMFGPTGAAIGWGKVFAPDIAVTDAGSDEAQGRAATHISAYDAETGEEIWTTRIADEPDSVSIQPIAYDGLVLASTTANQAGQRGILHALDQSTGEIVWTFDTVEGDDIWGNSELNGGGGAWYPPAIDTEAGVVYWGTGNPYPFPGLPGYPNGSSRPGANLYSDSLVATDVETGEMLWYHQAIEHDLFDRDSMLTQIVELPDGGQVVVNTGKHGRILGFDPETHEVLFDTEVGMHDNDDLTEIDGPTTVLPGPVGGVETPIAAADGVIFASVVNAPSIYEPEKSSGGFEVQLGSFDSVLVAVDASDGSILWESALPGDSFGGATVVGDLVFTSIFGGLILAFDRESGEKVWEFQVPEGGINGWPAVAGDTIVFPVGLGAAARLVALRLGG